MRVRIHEEAAQDAIAAAAWYEAQRPGLGGEFYEAFESAVLSIKEGRVPLSPMVGDSGAKGAKRFILKRFPYDVVTVEKSNELLIVAVAHHSRKPGYWKDRPGTE